MWRKVRVYVDISVDDVAESRVVQAVQASLDRGIARGWIDWASFGKPVAKSKRKVDAAEAKNLAKGWTKEQITKEVVRRIQQQPGILNGIFNRGDD